MISRSPTRYSRWLPGLALVTAAASLWALEDEWSRGLPRQHKSKWLVSDRNRPEAPVVTPGAKPGDPPADAIILFDGKSTTQWHKQGSNEPIGWKVVDGDLEMVKSGSIATVEKFSDVQLHIEWRAPNPPQSADQARGNSGIFFQGRYELQVMDSYKNKTYTDGQAASLYAQHPPLANAARPPGEWQVYDAVWRAPRFDSSGKVAEPGRITVFHNGVLVQHNAEVFGETVYRQRAKYGAAHGADSLVLQDHGDNQPVRFRNIWARKLELTEENEPD